MSTDAIWSRFFGGHTGISPIRYLIRYRVSVACKMLGEDLSVTETGIRCGFSDPTNFFVRFKQVTGLTPSAYRKTMLRGTDFRR